MTDDRETAALTAYGSHLSLGGDSGGPWYTGGTALGLMQGSIANGNGFNDGIYTTISRAPGWWCC